MKFSRRQAIWLTTCGVLWQARTATAGGIRQSGFVRIGGIDQWIDIRGSSVANPAILYLHGGPGEAQSPFLQDFAPWERDFTVVNWDQRGAGKTFARNGISTPDLTLDRLVDDAIAVAAYACRRLSKRKVILVGQSWGSFLGVHVTKRKPELFYAFVGTGQVVNFAEGAERRVLWGRRQATAEGDKAGLAAINKAAALPPGKQRLEAELNATHKWRMSPQDQDFVKMFDVFLEPKPLKGEAADWMAGAEFSGTKLENVMLRMDVRSLGLAMPIPFFVIQGRDDHITDFELARDYVRDVRAPTKAFIPIEGGHYACFTNPAVFTGALREKVRPLAI